MQRQQQRRQQQPGPHKASALDDSSRNRHGSGDFEDCQTFDNEVLYGSSASASSNQVSSSTAPVEGNSDRNASRGSSTSSTSSNRGAVRRKAKQVTTAFKLKNLFMARSASAPTMRKNSGSIFNRNPAPSNTGRGSERAASNSDSSSPADSRGATLERRSSDPVKKPPLLPPPLDGAALTQKLKDSFHELHGILKKWRNEARPGADDAHRKELSEVLEVQVKMGQISSAEMMEILNKDDRAAADKAFNSHLEGEAEFVYVCEKIGYYVRKHFCAGGDGRARSTTPDSSGSRGSSGGAPSFTSADGMPSSPDDLAVIKVIRGAGADEIEVPRISTKLGVVTYNGHKGLIHEDSTVEEIDEKEAVFVEQFRSGGIDIDDFQEIMAKHKKFLALCMGENLERRRHETVVTWMSAMDNFDKAEVSDDDDDLPPRAGRGSASSSTLPNMDAGSASSSPGKSPGQDIAPIQNPFLLLQRKIRNKSQSLNSIRRSQSCSRWQKRGQHIPAVVVAVRGGAFDMVDRFRDGEPKVQQRMLAFLRDISKKKLGIAVFFMLPNASEDRKLEAEKLLHRGGFKGLYSGTILTGLIDEDGGNSHAGRGDLSPGKGGKSTVSPTEIRRHLESKRFHVVANMAMEPTWITGGFTDMHVHLKEEKDDDGAAAFGRRSRARALSYSSQSSEDDLGLPDLSDSGSSDDNDLGLPSLADLMGDGSSGSDNELGIPPLEDEGDDGTLDERGGGRRRRHRF